ncbi:tyrosine-type recombinase/integrase [Ferrimicrobium sp.]|uniref:site-specific integrase n=1 Tax=Ferrimicrobium sp. TaxID=2926050 RepID=UPI00262248A1|nr:tyrosine-type recombinase/integrase [Ferrimicrobium sp.]
MSTRRTRGQGSIYRSDNQWRALLKWTGPDGRVITRSRRCRTKAEAESVLAQFRGVRDAGVTENASTTVSGLLDRWLAIHEGDIAGSTQAQYQWATNHIKSRLGHVRIERLTPTHVDTFVDQLSAAGLSPRSRRLIRVVLSQACKAAVGWRLIASNPCDHARPIKLERKEQKSLSVEEARQLLSAARDDRLGVLWLLLLALGLRRGEALALRWSDVDLTSKTLTISRARVKSGSKVIEGPTKTARSTRTIPLPAFLIEALDHHRDSQQREYDYLIELGFTPARDYLFTSVTGTPLDPDNTSKAFQAFAIKAGLGRRHVHELRHAAASLMLAAGTPLPEVSRVLGHSSTRVTDEVYAHLGHEALRGAVDRLAGVLEPTQGQARPTPQ